MYVGPRKQNFSHPKPRRQRPEPSLTAAARFEAAPTAPVSALRLAAEAAFEARPFGTPPPSPTQVTVRKARVLVLASAPARADEEPSPAEPAGKAPRVFRLKAAPAAPLVPVDASAASAQAAARSRRVAPDKRPGPVLHLVAELPAREGTVVTKPQLDALIASLASVEPVLDAIRAAQSFEIVDPRAADEWQRLARVAEAIGRELAASRS